GSVAFLLEPDLKEAHGGLRDVHALRAAALAAPVLDEIVNSPQLAAATDLLVTVRVELHRRAARPSDRLLLQDQDGVAAAMDLGGPPGTDRRARLRRCGGPRHRDPRPARHPRPAPARVGGGAQQAPAQRLPPLHRRPAPARSRRSGGAPRPAGDATGPSADG